MHARAYDTTEEAPPLSCDSSQNPLRNALAMRDRFCFFGALWLLACVVSGCEASAKPERSKSTGHSRVIAAWQPNGPPPQVVVSIVAPHSNAVSVSIANYDTTDVELAAPIQIQRWHHGQWHPEHSLELRKDSASEVEPCVKLSPGAENFPPAFTEHACGCKACGRLAQGTYRAVVQTCDGKRRIGSTSH